MTIAAAGPRRSREPMSFVARLRRWFWRVLGRHEPPPSPDTTLIGRRLRLLGYDPGPPEQVERARRVERDLHQLREECLNAEVAERTALFDRVTEARQACDDYLAPRTGTLARAVAAWPREREALDGVLQGGEALAAGVRDALELLPRHNHIADTIGQFERLYAGALPARWSIHAGAFGLADRLRMAASAEAMANVEQRVEAAGQTLAFHLEALEALQEALLRGLDGRGAQEIDRILTIPDVEARVDALIGLLTTVSGRAIRDAGERLDEDFQRHLDHLRYPESRNDLAGTVPGTFTRAMVRVEQFRRAVLPL
jgi:hypothetical protein